MACSIPGTGMQPCALIMTFSGACESRMSFRADRQGGIFVVLYMSKVPPAVEAWIGKAENDFKNIRLFVKHYAHAYRSEYQRTSLDYV